MSLRAVCVCGCSLRQRRREVVLTNTSCPQNRKYLQHSPCPDPSSPLCLHHIQLPGELKPFGFAPGLGPAHLALGEGRLCFLANGKGPDGCPEQVLRPAGVCILPPQERGLSLVCCLHWEPGGICQIFVVLHLDASFHFFFFLSPPLLLSPIPFIYIHSKRKHSLSCC